MILTTSTQINQQKNSVTIDFGDDNTFTWHIYGAHDNYTTYNQEATYNQLFLKSGKITNNIRGGYSYTGDANNNTVTISGGEVAEVYGGYGYKYANDNAVNITGGTVKGSVYSGNSSEVTDSIITISGGTVEKNVYGGTTRNTVNYINGEIKGVIYGGETQHKQNTLNIGTNDNRISQTLSAKDIRNFETINFYLAQQIANNATILNLTGTSETYLSKTTVTVYLQNALKLNANSVIHLIKTNGSLSNPLNNDPLTNKYQQTNVNIANLINVKGYTGLSDDKKSLDLTFDLLWMPSDQTYNIISPYKFERLMHEVGNPAREEIREFNILDDSFDANELSEASNNTVNINLGSDEFKYVNGGVDTTVNIIGGNTVNMNSGTIHDITGAYSYSGGITDNIVNINGRNY